MAEPFYAAANGELRQGDISLAQILQLVPRNAPRKWPGPDQPADLPDYGDYDQLDGPKNEFGYPDYRVLVWEAIVIVVTQSCELDQAHPSDSRVIVAPIVPKESWNSPELWAQAEGGKLVPGFFYLPSLTPEEATSLGLKVDDLGPAVVDLASMSMLTRDAVRRGRIARLGPTELVRFQDAIARALTVRGLASTRELENLEGRQILSAQETAETSPGPVRLAKIHLSAKGEQSEDEVTVAWGIRSVKRSQEEPEAAAAAEAEDAAPAEGNPQ